MRIGELSERSGASPRSIRYYESVGLLSSDRDGHGYRVFEADAVHKIARIKLLLQVGLDIADIAAILPCIGDPDALRCAQARQRFSEQIARIERQQRLLAQAKALLIELRTEGAANGPISGGSVIRAVSGNPTVGFG